MASALIVGIVFVCVFSGLQMPEAIGHTSNPSVGIISSTMGPLHVSPINSRYFADTSGRIVYLTGSHTWSNFRNFGTANPPPEFDYREYLNFLERYHHNFVRLWTFELFKASYKNRQTRYATLWPWRRVGPGVALDGELRFDLSQFNDEYFDRLRARIISAGERGIYVSIMLFNGYAVQNSDPPWRWDGHPFNDHNNINGIGGDITPEQPYLIHTMSVPAVRAIQEAYVKKVIDTVNDLDNVLYEIANESGTYSTEWQYHFIRFIKSYEASKAKQHPVGMTFQYGTEHRGTDEALWNSPADWISPGPDGGFTEDPPSADGQKVIIADSDHLWGVGGNWTWVWKSFTRGLNPIYMDPYGEEGWYPQREVDSAREAMGQTRMYAERLNMAHMTPHGELASTRYALANPGLEYLAYSPLANTITMDLTGTSSIFGIEWFNPRTGEIIRGGVTTGGSHQTFDAPFTGDVVLYLVAAPANTIR